MSNTTNTLFDSGILPGVEQYMRIVLFRVETVTDEDILRVRIVVHRYPSDSQAQVAWFKDREWITLVDLEPNGDDDWWGSLPSYTRTHQRRTLNATKDLVERLLASGIEELKERR